MGHGVQPYMDLIDQIRELGIEREIEGGIPQIAVMGDQSSGKSSVNLPSSSGLAFIRYSTVLPSGMPRPSKGPSRCQE